MKKKQLAKAITLAHLTWCGALISPVVMGAPTGWNVINGTASVSQGSPSTPNSTNVDISTDFAEISWETFDIEVGEDVDFNFNSEVADPSSGIVVNKVLQAGSSISGSLTSNGHVVLINPRGVLFNDGASVDVGALTVSTLGGTISGRDGSFSLEFDETGQIGDGDHYFSPGTIENSGTLLADRGITLIGRSIQNLTVEGGLGSARIESATIDLVAADSVTLSLDSQSGLYGVEVTSASLADELIVNGNDALISGSKVLMTAAASDAITATAVNNSGTVEAKGIDLSGGVVRLTGSGGGAINNTGTITVSADAAAAQDVAAGSILIEAAEITQSGTISASAVTDRSGGNITLAADDRLEVSGAVTAAGSGAGNSGGAVVTTVTASTGQLVLSGSQSPVNTAGQNGSADGSWEISAERLVVDEITGDPTQDCGSGCIDGALLSDALADNATVTLMASGTQNDTGISIRDRVTWSSDATLVLKSEAAVEVQDFINGQGQSELAGGNLSVEAESGFLNAGAIAVSDFDLRVGRAGSNTNSELGDLSYTGSFSVAGGSGFDSVSFSDMDGALAFSATDSSEVSLSNGALSGTLTDIDAVVAEAGDTLSGTAGGDTFTLIGAGGVQSNGINFTGIGTLDGGDGTDTLIGQSGVAWSLTELAQSEQDGVELVDVEILQASNASLTGVSNGEQIAVDADSEVTVSSLSDFRFTNLATLDVTGIANVSLDTTALGSQALFLLDTAGTVSTTENIADGIGFSGFSTVAVNVLDATALGVSPLYFRNLSGASLSTASGGGTVFSGLSTVTVASLDSDGFAADLALVTADGRVTSGAGAVEFSGVDTFRGSDGSSVSGGNSWALGSDGTVTESVTGIRFDGAWEVTTSADGSLADGGSGSAFTLDSGVVSIANSDLVFSGLASVSGVSGSSLNALSLAGDALYLTDATGTIATAEDGSGITFSSFTDVSVARLDTVSLGGGELFLRNSQGTSASTGASSGTLFSGLESVAVSVLHTNGLSPLFDISGAGSIQIQSDGTIFSQLSEVTSSSGAEIFGGPSWALDVDGNTSEAGNQVTFSGAWTVNASEGATLTGTDSVENFTVNSDGELEVGSNLIFSGLDSVLAGAGADTLSVNNFTLTLENNSVVTVDDVDLAFQGLSSVTGGGTLNGGSDWQLGGNGSATELVSDITLSGTWAVSTVNNATLTDSGTGSAFTLANGDVGIVNSGLQFSNLGSVTGVVGSSLDASALGDAALYVTDAAGTVATETDGSGIEFSNFSGISVAHLDATTLAAGELYLRNAAGSSVSTGAASGTLFSSLEQVSVNRLFTNGLAVNFDIAGVGSIQAQGGGTVFTELSEVAGSSGAEISGGGDWTLDLAGGTRESTSSILFSDLWFVDATGGSLTGTANTDIFSLDGSGDLAVGTLTFTGLASVSGGGSTDTLDATGFADGVKLENGNDSVSTAGILFGEVETVETIAVTGADAGTAFSLVGGGVTVDGSSLNFVGVESVDGGSANSALDATSLGAAPLYLLNASNSLVSTVVDGSGGITFTNFGGITVSQLDATGMGSAPLYLRNASGTQVSSTRTGGTLISGLSGVQASRLDSNGNAATLSISGAGSLATAAVTFSNVMEFSGGDASTVSGGTGWSVLAGTGVEENSSGIDFSGNWIVDAAGLSLSGSDSGDTFVLNADGSVEAEQVTLRNLTAVLGGSGQDTLNAAAYADTLNLIGTAGALDTATVVFREIEDVSATSVNAATAGTDFARVGDLIVADGLNFSGLAKVNGVSAVDTLSGANALFLRADSGGNYFADDSGVEFRNIDAFSTVSGSLTDEVGAAGYVLLGRNRISVDGIDVSGLSQVTATGSGVLDASGYADGVWLSGATGEVVTASTGGLTFSGMGSVTSALVTGSGGGESFSATGTGTLSVLGMTIDGVAEVFAGSGAAQVTAASGQDWELVAGANGAALGNTASTSGIEFTGFTTLVSQSAALLGTAGDEAFTLTGSEESGQLVGFGDMQFSGLGEVYGGGGSDSLDATGYTSIVSLTTTDGQLAAGDLVFFDFSSAQMFTLSSDDGNEHNFHVTDVGTVSVEGMTISALNNVLADESDIVASDGTVISDEGPGFETLGIQFNRVGLVSGELIAATRNNDEISISASGLVTINGREMGFFARVDGLEGEDTITGFDGQDWTISGLNSATSLGIEFVNFEHLVVDNGGLIGSVDAEVFTLLDDGRVRVGNILAEGMAYIDGGAGGVIDQLDASSFDRGLQLTGTDGLLLADGLEVRGFETAISPLLLGGSAAEVFTLGDSGLVAGGITFSGLSTVNGGGGNDRLDSDLDQDWLLGSAGNTFSHAGVEFAGIETAAGGSGAMQGGAADSEYTLGNGVLQVSAVDFEGVTSVDAGAGRDTVATEAGLVWSLDGTAATATVDGVTFRGIETVSTVDASIDTSAASGPQVFELGSAGRQVSILDILFSSVSSVVASDGNNGDTVVSAADQWQLQGSRNSIAANGVLFSGIDSVEGEAAELIGTAGADEFQLASGTNSLAAAGIAFSGVEQVSGAGGADTLVGTGSDDTFSVAANGDIRAAAMQFTGLAGVDGGAGSDVVDGAAASWTSATDPGGLVSGSALATVDSVTVVFENLERVENTGDYSGPAVADDYYLTGPDSLNMGGVEFAGLQTLAAGSGANTLYGFDADMTWRLGRDQGVVSDGQSSLAFSGFDTIIAGGGADQFELGDAVLASLDTGAGDDSVQLQQAQLAQLSLGADNDVLVVSTAGQSLAVAAGTGEDRLQVEVEGQRWLIDGDIAEFNSVGSLDFRGFELLADTGGGLDLSTSLAFDFYGSADPATAGIEFSTTGMTLAYDPSGDLNLVSRTANPIGGELYARNAALTLAGDLDIVSNVEVLSLFSSAGDIDASVVATEDLIIGQIDIGRGHLSLLTSTVGALYGQSIDDLHITAGSVELGRGDQRWENIGTASVPLRVDIRDSLDIVAFNFYEPIFEGGFPVVTATGEGIPSLISAQASQGLKSAVQRPTEDIAQLDPGIFDEVTPYSLGMNTLNAPEMRLTASGLKPAEEEDEEDEEREAETAPVAGE
ncbi:filamentous hemagglutinin N-terminal domain-containing protein [Microbulbifer hydrolyticus]|nr:filamentous hemagglutinin N-terminal domain-containing protein [Microbulbifer hydrolyticus]